MRQKPGTAKPSAESMVKDIRRRTRKHHSAEEKIRIVLEGLRGEDSIAELCRRERIATSLYYSWSKEFLEAGKKRLAGAQHDHGLRRMLTGKSTDNGFIEAFNSKLRSECLNAHRFMSLADAREKLEDWRRHYNEDRPHSAIGYNVPIAMHYPHGVTNPSS